ncbi:serine/threonine-protein kinase [Nannocystis sp. SCPEA4]|uniref:serine/threonine-protein kinase n=1 Tax=Nannocystis sp. SCPEA4 TaxID=2996787 RepID=UPI00226F8678|nr:serine/threonine-protein kinase [Nannocystis sp. SCPEA4]MCY1062475.1 serine/threonine-protein kinase [Nannocystis sp. SCPEA4]
MDSLRSPCLDEAVLLDFAGGGLDSAARADVERHIDACRECFEVLAALSVVADVRAPTGAAGRYTIERVRGTGAMGTVYEAHDPVLDRTVAVKVLRADLQPTEQRRLRLLREAQSLARIDHPNVVSVYDAGEAGADVYIAMELIDGEPLDEHLRRRPRGWREVVDLFAQAGAGLAAAHEAGLVHRDFKPSNVLVDAHGRVVVTDFGLAASLDASDDPPPADAPHSLLAHTLSATAARLGTPAYMAPEQFEAQRATAQTDQFAFCVALVEALGGQRPFAGTSAEMWTRAQARGPDLRRLPGPARLARVLARGLAFAPAERHPSMRALLGELRRCQALRRRRVIAALASVATCAAAAGFWIAAQPPAGCVDPLADSWGPEERARVEARLADPPATADDAGAHLRSSKQRALATLDAHATALAGAYAEICPDLPRTVERGTLEQRGQWTCLQSRRAAFAALTGRLREATPAALPSLLAVVGDLESASDCLSPPLALRDAPQPEDPDLGARVQALRLELALARLKIEADDPAARDELTALLRASEALGYAPLHAEVLARLGYVDLFAFAYDPATQHLGEAYAIAVREDHEPAAALAARGMIRALLQNSRFDEARGWAEAVAPLHRTAGERIELSVVRAHVARLDAELDEAQRHIDEAFALRATDEGAEAAAARRKLDALLHMDYGDLLVSRDDYQGAKFHYEQALQLQRDRLGSGHAGVVDLLVSLAQAERLSGELAVARGHLEEALAAAAELDIKLPYGWADHGEVQSAAGEYAAALASFQRARETGLGGIFPAYLSLSEAHALRLLGRTEESRRTCEAAVAGFTAELGPDHARTEEARQHCRDLEEIHVAEP